MTDGNNWRTTTTHLLAAGMIFCSPLIQGGTPRLGIIITEVFFVFLLLVLVTIGDSGRCRVLPLGPVEMSLYLFLFIAALNLIIVPYYHDAERCFLMIVMYAGTFSAMIRLPGKKPLAPVFLAVKITALFQTFLAFWQKFAAGSYQPNGTFSNPNYLAGFLVTGAALFLVDLLDIDDAIKYGLINQSRMKIVSAAGFAAVFLAVVFTRSRGGMIALVLVLACLLVYRFKSKALLPIGILVAGLLIVPNPLRQRLTNISMHDVYAYSRIDIWKSAMRMFADHPFLGVGLGQYKFFSFRYAFPVKEYWTHFAKIAENPHSEYLMLAAELGVAGLSALIIFAMSIFFRLKKAGRPDPDSQPCPLWPLLILAGVFAHAAVDSNLHSPPIVLSSIIVLGALVIPVEGRVKASGGVRISGKLVRWILLLSIPVYMIMAARPVVGFYYFLKAGGGPVNLMDEQGSLSQWGSKGRQPDYGLLNRAIFWDGDCAPYHSALGSLAVKRYAATGQSKWLDLAMVEINTAIKLNSNNHRYHEHLADLQMSLYQRGEVGRDGFEKSMDNRRKSLSLSPSNVFVREKLAWLELEYGEVQSAADNFMIAVKKEPCFLRANFELGLSLEKMGRIEDARRQYQRTVGLADQCRQNPVESQYERSLIDMDMSLVHNRLESLAK